MMRPQHIYGNELDSELNFSFSKSSGPGGQNVNKVNTKVELRFAIDKSSILEETEKQILKVKLDKQLNSEGELIIVVQETRSQLKNKQKAVDKFYELINSALKPIKKRKATKVSRAAKEKRLKQKQVQAEKKSRRRKDFE